MEKNKFNMVMVGTGGQGLITLLQILASSALAEKKEFKTSELHGLSQRGGSVEVHIRIGKNIKSPLVSKGKADLILALETQEALRAAPFSGKETFFLVNSHIIPIPFQKPLPREKIEKDLKKISKSLEFSEASKICRDRLGKEVVAGVYLLALASLKKLIPLKPSSLKKGIRETVPKKYLELNLKALSLAEKNAEKN